MYFSQSAALVQIDPEQPPSVSTAKALHDRVQGPRDTYGRRIWSSEVIEQIRAARAGARKASGA